MEQLVQQLRLSARSLARARGFFVSAVLVLAIAIGATAAVFGLVDAVLLRPLPFRDADRLLVVWEKNAARHRMRNPAGPSNLLAWRERSLSFASLEALYIGIMPTLGGGEPERVRATRVTPGLLPSLGVAPVLGRQLRPEEGLPGRGRVAVLSHELFVRRFGGDPAAVGGSIELDGVKHEIAGVLPAGFRLFAPADVLVPLTLDPADRTWQGRSIVVIGRLAPGATQERAQGEMTAIAARLATEYPEGDTGWTVNLVSLKEQLTGELRPALLVLFGAVGLVLLIACTNVANLVLARTAARRHELGVRLALGASGGRLFTQLAAESVLVALAGGAAGLFLARLALDVASAAAPRVAPSFALSARLSPRVVLVALASALAAALVTSLAAVLAAREKDVVRLLKRGTASPAHARTRSALVVGEMALSVVLLVGAGLLTRSVLHLLAVDPGFEPERAVTLTLTLPRVRYDNDEKRAAFLNAALERAAALPGVVAAGTVSTLPLDGLGSATTFTVRGAPPPAPGQKPVADVRAASGAYFAAMGIPLVAG
ncbi:MAG TPA: ABC transporter permease, partial [Thermoanaerobaculia bacterium]|nr:ABC transporter permease [Thermoanaerobaculia bacterium]